MTEPTQRTLQDCVEQYTELIEFHTRTKRRWQWIAVASGVAGLGLGVALGATLRAQPSRGSSRERGTR